jgi:hypothetical protein
MVEHGNDDVMIKGELLERLVNVLERLERKLPPDGGPVAAAPAAAHQHDEYSGAYAPLISRYTFDDGWRADLKQTVTSIKRLQAGGSGSSVPPPELRDLLDHLAALLGDYFKDEGVLKVLFAKNWDRPDQALKDEVNLRTKEAINWYIRVT